eukprot:TRINITY_DN130_c0_g1_i1.p1 TRINITY_DN130_c0_g1~~TRINITY_DN130_c0_g1_i1.p1  ORF type:complete len:173 (-),score=13.93 TRINITY_DN130_c0_g1_i1:29-547(-)
MAGRAMAKQSFSRSVALSSGYSAVRPDYPTKILGQCWRFLETVDYGGVRSGPRGDRCASDTDLLGKTNVHLSGGAPAAMCHSRIMNHSRGLGSSIEIMGVRNKGAVGKTGALHAPRPPCYLAGCIADGSAPVLCVDTCLLYTSDAADEEDSVDLGGRRIIKKKNNREKRRRS